MTSFWLIEAWINPVGPLKTGTNGRNGLQRWICRSIMIRWIKVEEFIQFRPKSTNLTSLDFSALLRSIEIESVSLMFFLRIAQSHAHSTNISKMFAWKQKLEECLWIGGCENWNKALNISLSASVACKWAGAVMQVILAIWPENPKKKLYWQTNRTTN